MSGRYILELLQDYLPELPPRQHHMLNSYLFLLKKWNRTYNLTSITTAKAMVLRHVLDSLSISPHLKGSEVLDVGTGAGLPGLPLAIVNPRMQFVLLDSNNKKIKFLQQTKIELKLRNVEIAHLRIEDFSEVKRFDTIVSRAFSSANEFFNASRIFLKDGGTLLAMKGVYPLSELDVINDAFSVDKVEKLTVPDLNAERHVIIARVKR